MYVGGNPINSTDPSGRFFQAVVATVVIVSIAAPIVEGAYNGIQEATDPDYEGSDNTVNRISPYYDWRVQDDYGGPVGPGVNPFHLAPHTFQLERDNRSGYSQVAQ